MTRPGNRNCRLLITMVTNSFAKTNQIYYITDDLTIIYKTGIINYKYMYLIQSAVDNDTTK